MFSSSASTSGSTGGQQAYTTAGTYTWVAPAGVTSVSVVAVGGGGSSRNTIYGAPGAGGLGYKNNYSVIPGNSYTVKVGAGGTDCGAANCTRDSYFVSRSVVSGKAGANQNPGGLSAGGSGGTYTGDGGGNGGAGGCGNCCSGCSSGGGGAGGYSGSGGQGGGTFGAFSNGASGAGGGGGGGGGGKNPGASGSTAGGGGVGILGQGSNGAGGSGNGFNNNSQIGGGGGSGGSSGGSGSSSSRTGSGGAYGGASGTYGAGGVIPSGGVGAVRIIWPGNTRSFPSTNTGNV